MHNLSFKYKVKNLRSSRLISSHRSGQLLSDVLFITTYKIKPRPDIDGRNFCKSIIWSSPLKADFSHLHCSIYTYESPQSADRGLVYFAASVNILILPISKTPRIAVRLIRPAVTSTGQGGQFLQTLRPAHFLDDEVIQVPELILSTIGRVKQNFVPLF